MRTCIKNSAAVAILLGLVLGIFTSATWADVKDYEFQLVQSEMKKGDGAIVAVRLIYKKTGKFIPADLHGRYDVIQWTFWQMGGLGPMAGQNHHFRNYAVDKIPYAIDRYVNETNRLYGVLNKRLADREFIGGGYSIADMACYPWVVPFKNQGQDIEQFPHLKRWLETIKARPATERAYALAKEVNPNFGQPVNRTEEERRVLFGQTAAVVK